jgi:hypothetical protein
MAYLLAKGIELDDEVQQPAAVGTVLLRFRDLLVAEHHLELLRSRAAKCALARRQPSCPLQSIEAMAKW